MPRRPHPSTVALVAILLLAATYTLAKPRSGPVGRHAATSSNGFLFVVDTMTGEASFAAPAIGLGLMPLRLEPDDSARRKALLKRWESGDLDPGAACKFLGDCPKP